VFSDDIAHLFSLVVTLAEKAGKHVELMVVTGRDPNLTLVEIGSASIVAGVMGWSGKMTRRSRPRRSATPGNRCLSPGRSFSLQLYDPATGKSLFFNSDRIRRGYGRRTWTVAQPVAELSEKWLGPKLHHRDVIRIALRRLSHDVHSHEADDVVRQLKSEMQNSAAGIPADGERPANEARGGRARPNAQPGLTRSALG